MRAFSLLRTVPWLALLAMAAIPAIYSAGPVVEAQFFPVVSRAQIEREEQRPEGVMFYVSFNKLRQCEFLGISWYKGADRIGVEFEPDSHLYPNSRPRGDQFAGPWLARRIATLDGTQAVAHHRCHPLWVTDTHFFP